MSRQFAAAVEALEPRQLLSTYYLNSASGSDANAGTSTAAPWRSLAAVMLKKFKAGDSILLHGGQTFAGKLYLDSSDKGTPETPIRISSYATGRATIAAGNDSGILILNAGGVDISNLTVVGSGYPNNKQIGIYFYNSVAGNVKLPYVHINTVDVKGFKNGIGIGGGNGTSGYSDVQITYSTVHENAHAGIFTFGTASGYSHKGVYIGHCFTYDNTGISADPGVTGHGIVLSSVEAGTVDRCTSYNNGTLGNGGAGVWAYDSTKILFQYSTSFSNKTAGPHDGDGFDFDQNVSSSVMQYNYSHDNDGAGYLLSTKYNNTLHKGNVIRYNISQNDCRKLNYGALHIWGKTTNDEFHNNTVYLTPSNGSIDRYGIKIVNDSIVKNSVQSVHFRNNIIQTTGGIPLLYISGDQLNQATDLAWQGNCWFSSGASFKIKWGSINYSSLSSWRSARNQEMLNGSAVGFAGDPQLIGAGQGAVIGNADRLNRLTSYKLASTSPLINSGINLFSQFGIKDGGLDYWGTVTPSGGNYDVGADEFS